MSIFKFKKLQQHDNLLCIMQLYKNIVLIYVVIVARQTYCTLCLVTTVTVTLTAYMLFTTVFHHIYPYIVI